MTDAAIFRKQAEECREHALKAISSIEKQRWLLLSEKWLRLAQGADIGLAS